jgi:hypothetical protein
LFLYFVPFQLPQPSRRKKTTKATLTDQTKQKIKKSELFPLDKKAKRVLLMHFSGVATVLPLQMP